MSYAFANGTTATTFSQSVDLSHSTTDAYKTDFKELTSFDAGLLKYRWSIIACDMFRDDVTLPGAVTGVKLQPDQSDITARKTLSSA